MLPLSRMPVEAVRQVTTLLFDLDGTFVTEDNLESETYRSLERVRENGIKTIAVTGRPAGWCDLMARWWPVDSVASQLRTPGPRLDDQSMGVARMLAGVIS